MVTVATLLAVAYWAYRARVGRIRAEGRAVAAERSRIARELHDTLMQGFSGITMEMQALATQLPRSGDELSRSLVDDWRAREDLVAGQDYPSETPSGAAETMDGSGPAK